MAGRRVVAGGRGWDNRLAVADSMRAQQVGGALLAGVAAVTGVLALWRDYPRPVLIGLLALAVLGVLLAVLPRRRQAAEVRGSSTTFRQSGNSRLYVAGNTKSGAGLLLDQGDGGGAHFGGDVHHDPQPDEGK